VRIGGARPFNKGKIKKFEEAIIGKLTQITGDLKGSSQDLLTAGKIKTENRRIEILEGSCLDILPKLKTKDFDFVITSPPYCNRYDYTRTYALELALLGVDEKKIRELRQAMLSCTVENRDKEGLEKRFGHKVYKVAIDAFNSQKALQAILKYLDHLKALKELNNPGIARMVKNYFFELSLVIAECSRAMKKNARFIMVNDNVRYAGITIPVDLILSDFAEAAGLFVEKIWVLPIGKGNSSQQMGNHGREELRKCVYVWKKL
jgi:DNA modification methylase